VWTLCICALASSLSGLLAGLAMLAASSRARSAQAHDEHYSALALVFVCLASPIAGSQAGPFWALHHESQPAPLKATSISLVNSLGNLGGFVGPYLLGALKARLGPACPQNAANGCVAQWAWGMLLVNGGLVFIFCSTSIAFVTIILGASTRDAAAAANAEPQAQAEEASAESRGGAPGGSSQPLEPRAAGS